MLSVYVCVFVFVLSQVRGFIFWGSKITADGDCSHEIKRHLLLGRKAMINLDSILNSRDITLSSKARLVKTMVFLVVIYVLQVGLQRKLSAKELMLLFCFLELMLLNCGVGGDS